MPEPARTTKLTERCQCPPESRRTQLHKVLRFRRVSRMRRNGTLREAAGSGRIADENKLMVSVLRRSRVGATCTSRLAPFPISSVPSKASRPRPGISRNYDFGAGGFGRSQIHLCRQSATARLSSAIIAFRRQRDAAHLGSHHTRWGGIIRCQSRLPRLLALARSCGPRSMQLLNLHLNAGQGLA